MFDFCTCEYLQGPNNKVQKNEQVRRSRSERELDSFLPKKFSVFLRILLHLLCVRFIQGFFKPEGTVRPDETLTYHRKLPVRRKSYRLMDNPQGEE